MILQNADGLKQKLLYTTLELETVKLEVTSEVKRNMEVNEEIEREKVKNLLNLLNSAYQERDEARNQLQKLLNNLSMPASPNDLTKINAQIQPESFLVLPPAEVNSSSTESKSLSCGSSSVESFFDTISSLDFTNFNNVVDSNNVDYVNQALIQEYNCSVLPTMVCSGKPISERGDFKLDSLVNGRPLPPKGKLLDAVKEAGPLLETLIVVGPLPTWRNPPTLKPIKIPPFLIRDSQIIGVSTFQKPLISSLLPGIPLSFSGNTHCPLNNACQRTSNTSVDGQVIASKRQKLR